MSHIVTTPHMGVRQQKREDKFTRLRFSSSERPATKRGMLQEIDAALSACEKPEHPNSAETISTLLDIFHSAARSEENETVCNNFDSELGYLALRILTIVERTHNFQAYFCKLLSSISLLCTRSAAVWRQTLRPLLNVFTNKKLEYVYLKRSVKEFKNISKCAESREMARFTKDNVHLLQGFSMLAFHAGDFLLQMDILEIVFMYTGRDKSLAKAVLSFGNQSTRQLIETLDFSDFQKDSRILLNALNATLGPQKRIFSINCNLVYFGNQALSAPFGMDGIWMDANRDSSRITISCGNFHSNDDSDQCVILQLPLREVEKLKLEFGSLSGGDCCCLTIKIGSLTEMYDFATGQSVVCTVLSAKNPREAVTDFVRVVEEISGSFRPIIQEKRQREKKNAFEMGQKTGNSKEHSRLDAQHRASCTSPAVFTICGTNRNGENGKQKMNQTSMTSPLTLPTWPSEKIKTCPEKRGGGNEEEGNFPSVEQLNMQVHQISISDLETSSPCLLNNVRAQGRRMEEIRKNEPSEASKLSMGKRRSTERSADDAIMEAERNSFGEMQMHEGKGRNVRRIFKDWEGCDEDFILTQEFTLMENNKTSIEKTENARADVGRGKDVTAKDGKRNRRSAKEKSSVAETRWNTSLLDPNGYAYRRWLRPTTSDRSNFWLHKLKDPRKTASKPEMEVFNFTDEGELSDDSKFFHKDKIGKARKPAAAKAKILGIKTNKSRKRNVQIGELEELRKGRWGAKVRRKLSHENKTEEPEAEVRPESGAGLAADTKGIAVDNQDPDCPYLESEPSVTALRLLPNIYHNNMKSEKEGELARGGKEDRCPPAVRNKSKRTGVLDELNDIATRLSSRFEEWMHKVTESEARHVRKCKEEATARVNSLAEEELEMVERSKRFELCIQYFVRGCSLSDQDGEVQAHVEKVEEIVKELNGKGKHLVEKVTRFAGRLRETVAAGAEATFRKHMKQTQIQQLENFFSYQREALFRHDDIHF